MFNYVDVLGLAFEYFSDLSYKYEVQISIHPKNKWQK